MTTRFFFDIRLERQWPVFAIGFVRRRHSHFFALVVWALIIEIGVIQ